MAKTKTPAKRKITAKHRAAMAAGMRAYWAREKNTWAADNKAMNRRLSKPENAAMRRKVAKRQRSILTLWRRWLDYMAGK